METSLQHATLAEDQSTVQVWSDSLPSKASPGLATGLWPSLRQIRILLWVPLDPSRAPKRPGKKWTNPRGLKMSLTTTTTTATQPRSSPIHPWPRWLRLSRRPRSQETTRAEASLPSLVFSGILDQPLEPFMDLRWSGKITRSCQDRPLCNWTRGRQGPVSASITPQWPQDSRIFRWTLWLRLWVAWQCCKAKTATVAITSTRRWPRWIEIGVQGRLTLTPICSTPLDICHDSIYLSKCTLCANLEFNKMQTVLFWLISCVLMQA